MNGGWSHAAPIIGIPPSRPRQFRNPEIVSDFAMNKEQQTCDRIADEMKKWITKEVIFDILYSMSQNTFSYAFLLVIKNVVRIFE